MHLTYFTACSHVFYAPASDWAPVNAGCGRRYGLVPADTQTHTPSHPLDHIALSERRMRTKCVLAGA
jgi:hypothetical protein